MLALTNGLQRGPVALTTGLARSLARRLLLSHFSHFSLLRLYEMLALDRRRNTGTLLPQLDPPFFSSQWNAQVPDLHKWGGHTGTGTP
jgi:hypothetical protein